jgi:hypothetical protein
MKKCRILCQKIIKYYNKNKTDTKIYKKDKKKWNNKSEKKYIKNKIPKNIPMIIS